MASQFDQLAELYERSMDELPFRRHIEQPSILAALGDITGKAALDMGCGSGLYTRLLARQGARSVTGMDASEGMIGYAREREALEPLGVHYVRQDVGAEVAPGTPLYRSFDVVLAVYLLPYAATVDALRAMCRAASNALLAHGRFVAATINPDLATAPHYYEPYGFDLTMAPDDIQDADPVQLHSQIAGETLDVTAHYWSRATQELALTGAGFTSIAWHTPGCVSGVDPAPYDSYLERPHTLIFVATM